MAAAASVSGAKSTNVSDEERRWVVIGICLTKVLTPALRDVLANEIPKWYQMLLQPPCEIDKQALGKHQKILPPSTLKLNYASINNNAAHKSPRTYDYAVKDPLSLAKLFLKPFMANFTGFDQTMDASAVLSVMCEAQPFFASGATVIAKKVRSDIRNEWAHCNFSHWTKPNFKAALQSMESLIKLANFAPVEQKRFLDELDCWKNKGLQLCFGQAVDPELLKLINSEVAELKESVKFWKDDQSQLIKNLKTIQASFAKEIEDMKERHRLIDKRVDCLEVNQRFLHERYNATVENFEEMKSRFEKIPVKSVFMAPETSTWFSGRKSEIQKLRGVIENREKIVKEKVVLSAVCGLGGCGKTSLVAEHAQQMKDHYQGGVFWFSGEDDAKLRASVNEAAIHFGTFQNHSFDTTLSRTLAAISMIEKPWLLVLDDMDELNISKSVVKLVSGAWQHNISGPGHLVITTRRKPRALTIDIRGFKESCCLKLECFCPAEANAFLFSRTGIVPNEENGPIADNLVRNLGGLPLALEQACAYIRYLDCPLSEYLQLYKKQSIRLLDEQKASPVSGNESPERLAVRTTWLLNFEHIKENKNGMVAIRFMNASAFMNPNEIQQELINVGEPPVEDGAYRDCVSTSLGSRQVIKLLTAFSLFKETRACCLTVHRLVQEVIRENLEPEQKAESIVDAVRLLRFAFSKCHSPDDLLTSVATERHERSSIRSTDPSFFYKWHKLCLHSYELLEKLKGLLYSTCPVSKKMVFLPETARIVYECALHLNVNGNSGEALTVAEFANRVYYFGDNEVSDGKLKALFPHMIPLPESVQRYIQYSCREPLPVSEPGNLEDISDTSMQKRKRLEEMRLEGNKLFKKSFFKECMEVYSSAIEMSKGTNLFDARFLSNRASAYLKLKQYDNALKDAEGYIVQRPECWKGYARKALALHGLNKKRHSKCAAALAFYRDKSVFCQFPPFRKAFLGLEKCISFCKNLSSLSALLPIVSPFGGFSIDDKIIVLEPGEYRLSVDDFDKHRIARCAEGNRNIERLQVGDCLLVGVENTMVKSAGVTLSFLRNFGMWSQSCTAVNISFVFDMGNWHAGSAGNSIVNISNCSFTSNLDQPYSSFLSQGTLNVENCCFKNCKGTGLNVAGNARIEDSVISGNEYVGLQVSPGGRLWLENSKLFGNSKLGLHIAKAAGKCSVLNCEIYDNKYQGVGVTESTDIKLIGNRIFHNDRHGIFIDSSSFAIIERNEIFENCWLGIATQNNASCRISRNRIYHNKCGGVHVVPVAPQPVGQEQVVEFNKIFGNGGPGIDESGSISDIPNTSLPHIFNRVVKRPKDLEKAKCIKNELYDNEEEGVPPTSKDVNNICFFCNKEGSLKKCTRCFTAAYCNSECQTQHWKKHKSSCPLLLERASVLVKVLPTPFHSDTDGSISTAFMMSLAPDFRKPLGPKHAKAPKRGKKIVIKIDAGDVPRLSNTRGSLLNVYDRSLTIHGDIEHKRFYNLVRLCGINSELSGWKTMFMWALIQENDMLRVFINEFPPYHLW